MQEIVFVMEVELNILSLLLAIFSITFFLLFLVYFTIMMKKIKHFKTPNFSDVKSEKSLDKALISIQNQINEFIDELNSTNKIINRSSAIGYFTLFIISALTFYLTL